MADDTGNLVVELANCGLATPVDLQTMSSSGNMAITHIGIIEKFEFTYALTKQFARSRK